MTATFIYALVGYAASALTTISFLPQAIKVMKTRDTRSLSLPMYILFVAGVTLWLIYGLLIGNLPVILGNIVTNVFAIIILIFKISEVVRKKYS